MHSQLRFHQCLNELNVEHDCAGSNSADGHCYVSASPCRRAHADQQVIYETFRVSCIAPHFEFTYTPDVSKHNVKL